MNCSLSPRVSVALEGDLVMMYVQALPSVEEEAGLSPAVRDAAYALDQGEAAERVAEHLGTYESAVGRWYLALFVTYNRIYRRYEYQLRPLDNQPTHTCRAAMMPEGEDKEAWTPPRLVRVNADHPRQPRRYVVQGKEDVLFGKVRIEGIWGFWQALSGEDPVGEEGEFVGDHFLLDLQPLPRPRALALAGRSLGAG